MKVWGTLRHEVEVNPLHVLEEINIINRGDWIIEKGGRYIQMTEVSAGQHSFDHKVGEVSKEVWELYKARELLINHLKSQQ